MKTRTLRQFNRWTLAVLGCLFSGCVHAAFLEMPVSPRAIGMGDAFVAAADDPFAPLYNPAGMARIRSWSAAASYDRYIPQLTEDRLSGSFLSVGAPWGAGLSYQRFQSVLTTEEAVRLTFARDLFGGRVSAGLGGAFLRNAYRQDPVLDAILAGSSRSKAAFGLDAGLLWRLRTDLSAGFSGTGLLSPDVGVLETRRLDPVLRAGFAWRFGSWKAADLRFVAGIREEGGDGDVNVGAEVWDPRGNIALRAGVAGHNLSTGFSVRVSQVRFDYAFMTYWGPSDLTSLTNHLVALTWSAGVEPDGRDAEVRRMRDWARENAARFVAEGMRLETSGEFGPAVAAYGKALAWDPEDVATAERLTGAKKKWVDQTVWNLAMDGKKAYDEGKMSRAILYWQQALSYRPGDPRLQDAIEAALQKKVSGAQRLLLDGLKAYLQGDYPGAVRAWSEARETYPRNQALKDALAEARRRVEHAEEPKVFAGPEAKSEVQRLSYEAIIYQRSGRDDLAAETWRKVLEKEPGNTEAKEAVTRLETRTPARAYAAPPPMGPRAKELYEAGLGDYAAGNLTAAISKWEEALKLAPDDINLQNSLIRARMERDPDEPDKGGAP